MHEEYSESADVHSFGVLLHELLTHQLPFYGRSALQAALAVCQGHRPTLPPQTPAAVAQLVARSWSKPSERLSFQDICDVLDSLRDPGSHLCLTPAEIEWLDEPSGHPREHRSKQPMDRCAHTLVNCSPDSSDSEFANELEVRYYSMTWSS